MCEQRHTKIKHAKFLEKNDKTTEIFQNKEMLNCPETYTQTCQASNINAKEKHIKQNRFFFSKKKKQLKK